MNRIFKNILFLIALTSFASCDDFMDVHKDWISDGETIYSVKLDSLNIYGGEGRLKVKMWLYNGTNVETLDI